ncbi:peroxidase-related enzyme [Rhizobium leguminosarum]|uniref:peroxidase-related enzyme n=1 Tax=Rhizobium leguminosarum TaxID=384 RepID=UPI001C93BE2E|nr:peroxidase-related enzyme [Rhizobium leguminosarum]MBY5767742.1 peroxidase-related enzyme [Rhizobium leguminosarum]
MSEVVHTFTITVPRWQPYVVPVDFATATDEQHAAMQTTPSNKGISPYVLTLAHDPETLAVRSPLFNLIMYGKDGLAASERELGAVATSVVNRCVYCAAVHASRFNNLTKRTDVIEAVFADGLEATLDEHLQAIFNFSARLSTTPPEAVTADAQSLADVGLDELEALDLVLSSAIFGWANRLMHTLGEPMKD